MLTVPTVLLRHTTADGTHHDWLLGEPGCWPAADARLWTARVEPASWQWAAEGGFVLTPLPPHRPRYLRYEGPISGDRGHVRRVDAGYALMMQWRVGDGAAAEAAGGAGRVAQGVSGGVARGVVAVRMRHFAGWIELTPTSAEQWAARVLRVDGGRAGVV